LPYGKKFAPPRDWQRFCAEWPTDDQISGWFGGQRCNLAVCCGQASHNLVVLVFNNRRFAETWFGTGYDAPQRWTWVAESVRGPHVYIRLDGALPPKSLYFNAGPSHQSILELRTTGAYVVAPPSRHPKGVNYAWLPGRPEHIGVLPSEEFRDWFADRRAVVADKGWPLKAGAIDARDPASPRRETASSSVTPGPIARVLPPRLDEGARNLSLASVAGTLRRRGLVEGELLATLLAVNAARGNPPLEEDEVAKIAASYARYDAHSDFLYADEQALR